jgi:hypothetical protein
MLVAVFAKMRIPKEKNSRNENCSSAGGLRSQG